MNNTLYTELAIILAVALYVAVYRAKSRPPLPPGPQPRFLVGNLFDFPARKAWITFMNWKSQYGDVVYMNALGNSTLVLNSMKACTDLMEKRSAKYSDRARLVMLNELMGWNFSFSLMGYSASWRAHRRLFVHHFSENAVKQYSPIQERGAHLLLRKILSNPEGFSEHLRIVFGTSIMEVLYGLKTEGRAHPAIQAAEIALKGAVVAVIPGLFLVDTIPALKYVPSWMPGAGFKRQAAAWKEAIRQARSIPFDYVKRGIADGTAEPTIVSSMLESVKDQKVSLDGVTSEDMVANAAAIGFIGGVDTTHAVMRVFFLAMLAYPEVQKTAQAEIGRITGSARLPTLEDRKDTPFINAVIKETLRWHPVTPLSIPHALSEDDVYEGYFIPKGTIVVPNVWAILQDPDTYPNPGTFDPLRWLHSTPEGLVPNTTTPDYTSVAFGLGRRICAGRPFADDVLYIICSNVLACFDILPPLDEFGEPVPVQVDFVESGGMSTPAPFEARIIPRSDKVAQLIEETRME